MKNRGSELKISRFEVRAARTEKEIETKELQLKNVHATMKISKEDTWGNDCLELIKSSPHSLDPSTSSDTTQQSEVTSLKSKLETEVLQSIILLEVF